MPRWWERLVACVALTAFLAANSTTAVQALSGRQCSCHSPASTSHDGHDGCTGCDDEEHSPGAAFTSHGPAHAPAPDGCPCPGGCAYCSIAKVPCPQAAAPTPDSDRPPGYRVADGCLSYAPPAGGPATPPPRA